MLIYIKHGGSLEKCDMLIYFPKLDEIAFIIKVLGWNCFAPRPSQYVWIEIWERKEGEGKEFQNVVFDVKDVEGHGKENINFPLFG